MTTTTARRTTATRGVDGLGDPMIALWAWATASASLAEGANPVLCVLAMLVVPVLALAATGRRPGRGAVVASVVSTLAVAMFAGGPVGSPAVAVILIGLLNLFAIMGGHAADAMRPAGLVGGVEVVGRVRIESRYTRLAVDPTDCV